MILRPPRPTRTDTLFPSTTRSDLGVAFLSLAQQPIWTWWALWTFLASASLFIKPTVWIAAVTSLFSASRGLSLAVTLCSTGIASSFVPLLTVFLLEDFGWRTPYLLPIGRPSCGERVCT